MADQTAPRTTPGSIGVMAGRILASLLGCSGVLVLAFGGLMYTGGSEADGGLFSTLGTGIGFWAMRWGVGLAGAAVLLLGLLRLTGRR